MSELTKALKTDIPMTSQFLSGDSAPKTPKGYIGLKEIAPIKQELIGATEKAEKDVGMADIEIEKAKRQEEVSRLESESKRKTEAAEGLRNLDERKTLIKAREDFGNMAFVPTKDTAMDVAGLFSLVSVIGMAIGGGGKQNAQQAMFAMNGMLEGYQKGRADLYKKNQIEFDKNFKAMGEKVKSLEKEYEDAVKLYQIDREAGDLASRMALMKAGSPILKAMEEKQGKVATLNAIKGYSKAVDEGSKLENDIRSKADQRSLQEEKMLLQKQLAELRAQGAGKATQQQFIAQRAVTALRGAASTIETVMQLPSGATVGFLPFLATKPGMINFIQNAGGRKMSKSEEKAVETLYSGMSRYLATIEASGTATGLAGLSEQLKTIYPKAGDTVFDVALKIADTRRIATEAVSAMVESGLLPKQQADAAEEQIRRFEKAVPFTTNDVVQARYAGKKTIGEATSEVAKSTKKYETEAEAEAAFKAGTLKSGEKVTVGGKTGTWE